MAVQEELTGFQNIIICGDGCKEILTLKICQSFAGYYIGRFCPRCGPYSRETGYFENEKDAELELEIIKDTGDSDNRRD